MLAFLFKDGEAVGLVVHRGAGKQSAVKSTDHRVRSKLFRLFNTSFDSLTFKSEGEMCEVIPATLVPGTPEHFLALVRYVNANTTSDFVMSAMGIEYAD